MTGLSSLSLARKSLSLYMSLRHLQTSLPLEGWWVQLGMHVGYRADLTESVVECVNAMLIGPDR
jgi:hypothetical protein